MSSEFVPSDAHEKLGIVVSESVTDANAILIRNHGPMCFGRNLAEARVCCQVTEKTCKLYLHLLAAGGIKLIDKQYIARGRDYFLNGYGKS
jgi:L-fuculose-phosphate aldolase